MVFRVAEALTTEKELECCECGKTINMGEEYYRKEEEEKFVGMCSECGEKDEKLNISKT